MPIIFHNLSNYDAHFIVKELAKEIKGHIKIIPTNTERYISVIKEIHGTKIHLKFIDSFRFMNSSLEKLASYLKDYPILKSEFPNTTTEKLKSLSRKGVFPYDYIKSWNTLSETSLPKIENFYNHLTDAHITKEDYNHACNVWKNFNVKTLGNDVHILYNYIKLNMLHCFR